MTSSRARLDIVFLQTFLEVVEGGSFTAAAERLALTPSAVSGHIKRLEQSTGARLLTRTTRRVEITPVGELLYRYARSIVSLEREARARMEGATIGERLRIGASEDFAGSWLAPVLQAFRRCHPEASIELRVGVTADLVRHLDAGQLDLVFGKKCARVPEDGEILWQEDLVWAYTSYQPFDADTEVPIAAFPEPCVYRESAIAALVHAAKPWTLVFESSSMAGCLAAAQAGLAVTPVARSQLREGLRSLEQEDGLPPLPKVHFYAFSAAGSAAARRLIDQVKAIGSRRHFRADHLPAPELTHHTI